MNRWLWDQQTAAARAGRAGLAPLSAAYAAAVSAWASAYRIGLLRTRRLPLPAVSVGNLSVGGSGKTPIASWMARFFLERGTQPAILLRGYGRDEGDLHRQLNPSAIVLEGGDRFLSARIAAEQGAETLVLDDAFQRLDVSRDVNVVLVAAESLGGSHSTLPGGPWRETWGALARASLVVVTRKRMTLEEAESAGRWLVARAGIEAPLAIAQLRIGGLTGLRSGNRYALSLLSGIRVIATAGIADPATFGAQLECLGARVELHPWPDHHWYSQADMGTLIRAAGNGRVVMTGKEAVKLRRLWPDGVPEPLIAELDVHWEMGAAHVAGALETLIISRRREPVKS